MTTPHDDPEEQRRNIKRAQIAQAAAEYYDKTGENPFIQLFNINESLKKVIAERDALREALEFYAVPENWHIGGPLDGNSGNFIGDRPARAALNREADT